MSTAKPAPPNGELARTDRVRHAIEIERRGRRLDEPQAHLGLGQVDRQLARARGVVRVAIEAHAHPIGAPLQLDGCCKAPVSGAAQRGRVHFAPRVGRANLEHERPASEAGIGVVAQGALQLKATGIPRGFERDARARVDADLGFGANRGRERERETYAEREAPACPHLANLPRLHAPTLHGSRQVCDHEFRS